MAADDISAVRLLDLKAVMSRVPFSRSSIYAMMEKGTFPRSFKIGENRSAWDSRDIDKWIAAKLPGSTKAV